MIGPGGVGESHPAPDNKMQQRIRLTPIHVTINASNGRETDVVATIDLNPCILCTSFGKRGEFFVELLYEVDSVPSSRGRQVEQLSSAH